MIGVQNTNPIIQLPPASAAGISNNHTLTPEQKYNQQVMQQNYDMSLDYVKDYYSAAVQGMQKAGLNPALMYNSGIATASYGGAGNAPYNQTDTTTQRYYNERTADANSINAAANLITSFSNVFDSIAGTGVKKSYVETKTIPNSGKTVVKGFGK